jgi:hypothetical protein
MPASALIRSDQLMQLMQLIVADQLELDGAAARALVHY